jgi:hypothetical protein
MFNVIENSKDVLAKLRIRHAEQFKFLMIPGVDVDYRDKLFEVISQDRNVEGYAVVQISKFMGDTGHKNAKRGSLLGVSEILPDQLHSCTPGAHAGTLLFSSI